jgi:hypothetical protein
MNERGELLACLEGSSLKELAPAFSQLADRHVIFGHPVSFFNVCKQGTQELLAGSSCMHACAYL